jgi:hypothetical protein
VQRRLALVGAGHDLQRVAHDREKRQK